MVEGQAPDLADTRELREFTKASFWRSEAGMSSSVVIQWMVVICSPDRPCRMLSRIVSVRGKKKTEIGHLY